MSPSKKKSLSDLVNDLVRVNIFSDSENIVENQMLDSFYILGNHIVHVVMRYGIDSVHHIDWWHSDYSCSSCWRKCVGWEVISTHESESELYSQKKEHLVSIHFKKRWQTQSYERRDDEDQSYFVDLSRRISAAERYGSYRIRSLHEQSQCANAKWKNVIQCRKEEKDTTFSLLSSTEEVWNRVSKTNFNKAAVDARVTMINDETRTYVSRRVILATNQRISRLIADTTSMSKEKIRDVSSKLDMTLRGMIFQKWHVKKVVVSSVQDLRICWIIA